MSKTPQIPPFGIAELEEMREELEQLYGKGIKTYSGGHHARYLPTGVPMHVICRVFQGRHMLRPTPYLRRLITGVIGRAQINYPDVKFYAAAFLTNHLHMMLSGPAGQLSSFIGYIAREVSTRWGKSPGVNWKGKMFEHYLATALPDNDSQILCLEYVLSQSVKEKIVARPEQWPGVHSARALMNGTRMVGKWFYGTGYRTATDEQSRRKHPRPVRRNDYWVEYQVHHTKIPAWEDLSEGDYQARVRGLVDQIVEKGRIARNGKPPLGLKAVLARPLNAITELPPQPWFTERKRMICWGNPRNPKVKQYIDDYWKFQREFRAASDAYRAGDMTVEFPKNAFKPSVSPPA